ncbi:hypothetical protein EAX61_13900 [Dokdonia sinensis]|uniref:Lipocalin-like domain-containing protein n=1 Tax=Dokdonia sinensis TaxID=2479847 RepID=A0A3M0G2S7_9FLAO|nr:DUF6252 family protein [Dokdonia sinensis]RMB56502.1 hypothetical protein EAX61_13900 [Dokdonia sinensis]
MKTLKFLMVAFIATTVLSLQSCKSDDDGGDAGSASNGTVTASVDGASYTSDAMGTSVSQVTANGMTTTLITSNEFSSSRNITLTLQGVDAEGTYIIGGGANISIVASYIEANASNPTDTQIWSAPFDENASGEVNIVTITDSKIEGTFEFTARNPDDESTVSVTNGSFNLDL